ncbi:hypothetical protein HDC36_002725 [Xanthomonas sp. JAI131]|jgi:hypothetical protein|uniref:hypothetical protein n=1 Tax=Xanthomonas sp. JAI131 TaxID=2723067 RepID=UPI0015CBA041|nr:hypothetical protein [Xanthomonas sp. JAI131]NYF21256.1 hypothetical protein [Xanthomonas sp. JAI131]
MLAFRPNVATALVALLALPVAALGHDTLPPDWCLEEGQEPQIVMEFDFNGGQLRELMDKCGVVDHEQPYMNALETIGAYCDIVAPSRAAKPLILGPTTFLARDHHSAYRMEQGLKGACVVCPAKRRR